MAGSGPGSRAHPGPKARESHAHRPRSSQSTPRSRIVHAHAWQEHEGNLLWEIHLLVCAMKFGAVGDDVGGWLFVASRRCVWVADCAARGVGCVL
eukprot:3155447-Prymnesium_polylepis.1